MGEHRVDARYPLHGGIFSYVGDVDPRRKVVTNGSLKLYISICYRCNLASGLLHYYGGFNVVIKISLSFSADELISFLLME